MKWAVLAGVLAFPSVAASQDPHQPILRMADRVADNELARFFRTDIGKILVREQLALLRAEGTRESFTDLLNGYVDWRFLRAGDGARIVRDSRRAEIQALVERTSSLHAELSALQALLGGVQERVDPQDLEIIRYLMEDHGTLLVQAFIVMETTPAPGEKDPFDAFVAEAFASAPGGAYRATPALARDVAVEKQRVRSSLEDLRAWDPEFRSLVQRVRSKDPLAPRLRRVLQSQLGRFLLHDEIIACRKDAAPALEGFERQYFRQESGTLEFREDAAERLDDLLIHAESELRILSGIQGRVHHLTSAIEDRDVSLEVRGYLELEIGLHFVGRAVEEIRRKQRRARLGEAFQRWIREYLTEDQGRYRLQVTHRPWLLKERAAWKDAQQRYSEAAGAFIEMIQTIGEEPVRRTFGDPLVHFPILERIDARAQTNQKTEEQFLDRFVKLHFQEVDGKLIPVSDTLKKGFLERGARFEKGLLNEVQIRSASK